MGRILIADDHDSLRRGLAQAIAEAGHDVEEAPNGNAAIEKLHEGFFDVVVSDLKMGGSTGLEVQTPDHGPKSGGDGGETLAELTNGHRQHVVAGR